MYLLKKVFELREKAHVQHEKPFLEHLEDLRVLVTRVAITLILSMLICFIFQEHLMDVMRAPAEKVVLIKQGETMPDAKKHVGIKVPSVETWNRAKDIERVASGLDDAQRVIFYSSLENSDMEFHARSVALLRATKLLDEKDRKKFVEEIPLDPAMRKQLLALLDSDPEVALDAGSNLRMMSALKPTETFMLSMKLSFFAGIVLAFPLLLMFILQFVLPGLHDKEKKILWPAMGIGFGLFLSGVVFSYFLVLPKALTFFYEWSNGMGVSNDWRIGEYISFATQFTLLFGLSFELPVVVMILVKLGLLTYDTMASTRRYAILAIYIAAAVITPTPDIMTLNLMALPMLFLYEICIWLAWFDRKKAREQEAEDEVELIKERIRRRHENDEREMAAGTADPYAPDEFDPDDDFDEHHGDDEDWDEDYHHEMDDLEGDEEWVNPAEDDNCQDEPEPPKDKNNDKPS